MMLITAKSTAIYAKRELGGKGYNLYVLSNSGICVPQWVGIGKGIFHTYCQQNNIQVLIDAEINKITTIDSCATAAQKIEEIILASHLSEYFLTFFLKAWEYLQCSAVAVRSSAEDEDSKHHSFAGQLSSFLFVDKLDSLVQCILKCWASAYSERSLAYRLSNNLPLNGINISVILQKMIPCEKSGVVFGCDPLTNNPEITTINAVYGVGEGLVSGALDADMYQLNKESNLLLSEQIVSKNKMFTKTASGETGEVSIADSSLIDAPVLSSSELIELNILVKRIESIYGWPQDIEWGILYNKIYILQTRPITTINQAFKGEIKVWDNSNIVESYGGITLPLTFSFANNAYTNVYMQICDVLHVSSTHKQLLKPYLLSLIGHINGRVYYNLLNWYRLLTILPGFNVNLNSFATIMCLSEELDSSLLENARLDLQLNPWEKFWGKIKTTAAIIYYHFNADNLVENFLQYFKKSYAEFNAVDYTRLTSDEILDRFSILERRMLHKWKPPIINDILCMLHFGTLKKLTTNWLNATDSNLHNALLAGEGSMESAEPMRELINLAQMVKNAPTLHRIFNYTDVHDLEEKIKQSSFLEFYENVENYIKKYGYRCMNELKLEQKDLAQDPAFLFICIKNYLNLDLAALQKQSQTEENTRLQAEEIVNKQLHGVKKIIFFWVLKHARKAVRNRENLRFCRTRIFGVARKMFNAMGNYFAKINVLESNEDIFYLTIQELLAAKNGTLSCTNFKDLVEIRKKEFNNYNLQEIPSRFETKGTPYWLNPLTNHSGKEFLQNKDGSVDKYLTGTPCSAGIVEGKTKQILASTDNLTLAGEILVTFRTDPGWIPLYPSISGLLVERGGLLSHSAIVAREMGIPTIVGIPNLTKIITSDMHIKMDGKLGKIEILN